MKYLSDDSWAKLPVNDFRPRFFVETYVEKLSIYTPHFYQSRLMNIFSCCKETLIYIEEYQLNEKNGGYILSVLDEIESCRLNDQIAHSMLNFMNEPIVNLFKRIRGGDLNYSQLNRLSVICRAILSREDEYSEKLLSDLSNSLFEKTDLNQVKRITSRIYDLTDLYITHLLNKGYSPTYLFNRAEMFTRLNNYAGKSFKEQFDTVTKRLNNHTTTYDVYFALHANKPTSFLSIENDPSFSFSDCAPECIQGIDADKLNKDFTANVIAKSTIDATDYVTASWRTKDSLDKLLDAVTALDTNPRIQVSTHCVSISRKQGLVQHTKSLNINLLLGFLTSESGTHFLNSEKPILHVFSKLNDKGKEQLGRSLRYLRIARESVSLEQKLLNLWISIESIFADGESSILINILEYVPSIYAVSALARRVRHLRNLLIKNAVRTTELIKTTSMHNSDFFDQNTTDSQIFEILRNEAAAIQLFESLGKKEHLKYKTISTFENLKDNRTIAKRLERSEADVTRQLRRIYFLRNKIAHTGHYSNIRPQLVIHLLDYLAVCYTSISIAALEAKPIGLQSINDLLGAYKMGVDVVINRAKSATPILQISEITPTPII